MDREDGGAWALLVGSRTLARVPGKVLGFLLVGPEEGFDGGQQSLFWQGMSPVGCLWSLGRVERVAKDSSGEESQGTNKGVGFLHL